MRVIVIGAGPAGSLCAMLLARSGVHVTLVEQHRFPRDKVCGECISSLGADVLKQHGLLGGVIRAGAVMMKAWALHALNGSATLVLPRPMYGVSRRALDALLLGAAEDSGVRLMQPARCERVVPSHRPRALLRDLGSNEVREEIADHLVVADGKAALMPTRPRSTNDLGLKAHFSDVDADGATVELFGLAGHYVGLAPIEGRLFNLAFSIPRSRLPAVGDDVLHEAMRENRPLRERMQRAWRVGDWLVSALPRFGVGGGWPEGVVPIGNAAGAVEPIGGEGIGLALRSAEMAAQAVIGGTTHELPRQFGALWRRRGVGCRAAAICVSSPILCRLAVELLNAAPAAAEVAMRLTAKREGVDLSHVG